MNKQFWHKNGSTILTYLGGAGVVATSLLTAKATPKAMRLIEEVEKEKGEELSKWETVRLTTPTYLPAASVGIATIACIFGANILSKRHQAALTSAYALLDQTFKRYRKEVVDLYGEEEDDEIMTTITVEKAEETYIQSGYFGNTCDLSVEDNYGENKLFYDGYSNRFFESTIEQVMSAEYHLNRNYVLRGYTVLNELYEFLGLDDTEEGSVLGWAPIDDGMYWIDFNHHKVRLKDGTEYYILQMPFAPRANYHEDE